MRPSLRLPALAVLLLAASQEEDAEWLNRSRGL
jgi:hypothetical protein